MSPWARFLRMCPATIQGVRLGSKLHQRETIRVDPPPKEVILYILTKKKTAVLGGMTIDCTARLLLSAKTSGLV